MVHFYGAMFRENDVWICMEVMDLSLDKFYRKVTDIGEKLPEGFIGKVAVSVSLQPDYLFQPAFSWWTG